MGIFGSVVGLAGSIAGGASTAKLYNKIEDNIKGQQQKNEDWYNRRYNEDATQRADAQALLTQTREAMRESNKSAAGAQAVMGGTEEGVAATKAANAKAMADAASQINQQADTRKDAIENQYMETDRNLNQQLNKLNEKRAGNIQQTMQGVSEAANGMGQSLGW